MFHLDPFGDFRFRWRTLKIDSYHSGSMANALSMTLREAICDFRHPRNIPAAHGRGGKQIAAAG